MTHLLVRAELIVARFEGALRYLNHLESIKTQSDWVAGYKRFIAGKVTVEEALALVNPLHLDEIVDKVYILGPRSFHEQTSAEWCGCQADLVWGYSCPIAAESFQADHLFPYSAGGPTAAENRIWLCPGHNRVKSSDIHLYSWEAGTPDWVAPRLSLFASRLL